MKKVLFISHYSGRTGAPIALLNFLQWVKENTDLPFAVLVRLKDDLQEAFDALAPENNFSDPVDHFDPDNQRAKALLKHFAKQDIGLIYSNTVTNGQLLDILAPLGCPVITHAHELTHWIKLSGETNWEIVKKHSDYFIAASHAVRENLIANFGISSNIIDVVHECVPVLSKSPPTSVIEEMRTSLGIPLNAFVVIGSGHESWRKGRDVFFDLAKEIFSRDLNLPIYFIWLDSWNTLAEKKELLNQVEQLSYGRKLVFTGLVNNPLDYFAAADVFAMVSREDPFPLTCLEAAALGKPILCFADAGGMPEFVEEDAGFISPYLDIPHMAENILLLQRDNELRRKLGANAAKKVAEHFETGVGAKKILKIIKKVQEEYC